MNVYTVIYDDDSTMDEGYPMVFGIFSTFDKACAYAGSDGFERVTSDGCATDDDMAEFVRYEHGATECLFVREWTLDGKVV